MSEKLRGLTHKRLPLFYDDVRMPPLQKREKKSQSNKLFREVTEL